jgi:hypothetical protein
MTNIQKTREKIALDNFKSLKACSRDLDTLMENVAKKLTADEQISLIAIARAIRLISTSEFPVANSAALKREV